jgi:hypothetical protein
LMAEDHPEAPAWQRGEGGDQAAGLGHPLHRATVHSQLGGTGCREDEATPARLRGPGSSRYGHVMAGSVDPHPRAFGGKPRRADMSLADANGSCHRRHNASVPLEPKNEALTLCS